MTVKPNQNYVEMSSGVPPGQLVQGLQVVNKPKRAVTKPVGHYKEDEIVAPPTAQRPTTTQAAAAAPPMRVTRKTLESDVDMSKKDFKRANALRRRIEKSVQLSAKVAAFDFFGFDHRFV
jgi:hypothetical protein